MADPGPWTMTPDEQAGGWRIRGQGVDICFVYLALNAHPIIAVPDMIEALEQIVFDWDGEPEDMAAARAALAKARGGEGE